MTSITNGLHVSGSGGIDIEPLLGDGPISDADAATVKERVEANPIFRGVIAGKTADFGLSR